MKVKYKVGLGRWRNTPNIAEFSKRNRYKPMKDWTGNRKSTFVTLGASNHTDKERERDDFYATDPVAIDKLFGSSVGQNIPDVVWECACGNGCLSERMKELGCKVYSSDIVDRGYGEVQDFLTAETCPEGCRSIITNPPYKYAMKFVKHSLSILPENGWCIMFLKTTFLEGQKRWEELFSITPPSVFCSSVNEYFVPRMPSFRECVTAVALP